jgi:hypothetical protein
MSFPSRSNVFVWILKAFVVIVFVQTAIPVDGQCLRRRRVPTLDFPTNIPMWEIYGLNPYAPIKVQPIPFMPLQVSNVAAVRVAESVEVLGDQDKVIEDAILEQLVGKAEPENSALKGEIESLKRDLDQIKAIADENLKRAKRAELAISKFKTKPKVGGSKGQNTDAVKGDAKGRRAAKRGTAALKQELAKIEKSNKLQEKRVSQRITREFQKKVESLLEMGKSDSGPAVKALLRERDQAVAKAKQGIREKSKKRVLEIQKELSARARS